MTKYEQYILQLLMSEPQPARPGGENMNREPGYYWIWNTHDREWQPAEWNGSVWLLLTEERWYRDSDLEGMYLGPIGPKIEPPPDWTNVSSANPATDKR